MENKNVIRFAFTVGGFTMLSRFLGMVRDVLTAGVFGTSLAMSSFVVAFRIPNLFRALFGEGALSSAFVPVFMASRRSEGEDEAWLLARRVVTLVGAVLLGIVILGIAGMSAVLLWPGLGEKAASVLPLARIMLPYVFFICMAALAMAVLNSYRKFLVSAFTPALLNITWILAILFIVPLIRGGADRQIYGLAWTVFVAGVVQLAYQVPSLWRVGWRPGVNADWRDPRVKKVFMLMGPSALGLAVNQINVMVNSLIAMMVGSWAPSALFYAERLIYFPQGILATSLGTVLLPVLSDFAAQKKHLEMREAIHHGLRTLLFVMTPAAVGLFVLAGPIVQMLFERGKFDPMSTMLTARALSFYAPGLMVFCLAKVFVPAFYALQDTRTPVKIGLCAVTLNLTLNVLFALTLPLYWRHAGMAFATVIAEGFNGLTLAFFLRRRLGPFGLRGILSGLFRALGAAAVMAVVAIYTERALTTWLYVYFPTDMHKVAQLIGVPTAIALGVAVYFVLARIFRFPELGFVGEALRAKKIKKAAKPVGTASFVLSGAIGSGKSTVVRAAMERLGWGKPAGFFTHWGGAGRSAPVLYLETWAGETQPMARRVLEPVRPGNLPYALDLARFNRMAIDSLAPPGGPVVVDELGLIELGATDFTCALAGVFRSSAPVLAVIQQRALEPWLRILGADHIAHLWTVDLATRDALPDRIAELLRV